ncbi:MAG: hypothetical protein AAGJ81_01285 [Verrucomicrobiota bacterium]
MKISEKLSVLLASSLTASSISAAPIVFNDYQTLGTSGGQIISGASTTGATLTYSGNGNGADGMQALFDSPITFVNVGDRLTYSYTVGSISSSVDFGANNAFRSGVNFDSVTPNEFNSLHYTTGYGDISNDVRMAFNTNANPYSGGTNIVPTENYNTSLRLQTGNTVDFTLVLELAAINGPNDFDYTYTGTIGVGNANELTIVRSLTGIKSDSPTGIYHLTNSAALDILDDTWTISNGSADFTAVPEPGAFSFLGGALSLALVAMRRRR